MDCKHPPGIDLHIHSTASDGSLTPFEILQLAQKLNLGAIAITDHDSLDGSKEAYQAGIPGSIKFLSGVEISAAYPPFLSRSGSFHLLGYAIRLDDRALNQSLSKLRQARKNRNPEILKRLERLGYSLTLAEIRKVVGEGQLGRPHIARAMVKKGYVASVDEAFDNFLGTDKPAYVNKYRIDCIQAVQAITDAGGIPVLAHPGLLNIDDESTLKQFISNLKEIGIRGIEVYYPEHSARQTETYAKFARQFDLLMTGGTDFHGKILPEIKLGSGKGNFFVPYELYEKLIQ